MRIIIIGAVAGGTSAATKARRNDESAEIIIYDKDSHISYSGCGMPYYLGGEVEEVDSLTPRDSAFFKSKYNVEVKTLHEVTKIDVPTKTIEVTNLVTNNKFRDTYDKLIFATGASAIIPPITGVNNSHVFSLRNIGDMQNIHAYIHKNQPKKAVIIGTGFIGLEVCDNLKKLGIEISLVERLPQIMPALDLDMAVYLEEHLKTNGVKVYTGLSAIAIEKNAVVLENNKRIDADIVLLCVGVKPNTVLAASIGVALGASKGIQVNDKMMTNIADIYACGDCIEQFHQITRKALYRPLGSTANKTGRIAGDVVTGGNLLFRGILGTGIFRILGLTVAFTGLSQRKAFQEGFDVEVCHNIKPNKPKYMGGTEMIIKGIADRSTQRLIGVQMIGEEGVDKRMDVFVTAITFQAKAKDLFHLDLAYAPPFSTTKDPVMYTGMILDNALNQGRKLISANELKEKIETDESLQLIDSRVVAQYEKEHVESAENIPHASLREALKDLDPNALTVTYCNKGVTGNAAQNILLNHGFEKVYNLSGGHKQYRKMNPNKNVSDE
ncbi:FAD-dependent oxidoreductase [Candidatus Galacturonibacter soehngenii]|uniref:Dehydrogenase n=1 Tax=Candidatus Galacturonatibacter soehngenii TaxID=2307010 RepID=A0A7V7QM83_9FIRM|nr:FAD-dependent oxidoreductase [Candidatus Galacturonibacter soehngenii]KAB1439735.1 dehydrogenase [Candidatus Galacturonibacter soehngenii]